MIQVHRTEKNFTGVMISGEQHQRSVKDKSSFLLHIFSDGFFLYWTFVLQAMRPKARGLAQHGGPPGCLEKSDLAGGILFVTDGLSAAFSISYRLL